MAVLIESNAYNLNWMEGHAFTLKDLISFCKEKGISLDNKISIKSDPLQNSSQMVRSILHCKYTDLSTGRVEEEIKLVYCNAFKEWRNHRQIQARGFDNHAVRINFGDN